MPTESNRELLNRIDEKLDGLSKELAAMQLETALKFSNFQNEQDKRYQKLEAYLQSDPATNQMGAIEKLEKVDRRVSSLETKATVFGGVGGALILIIKWVVSLFF